MEDTGKYVYLMRASETGRLSSLETTVSAAANGKIAPQVLGIGGDRRSDSAVRLLPDNSRFKVIVSYTYQN